MYANSSCRDVAISATFLSIGIAEGVNVRGCRNRYIDEMENRIREIRTVKSMTQEQLAEACGADKTQISKLENGTIQLTQQWMQRIAKGMECHPADLLPLCDFAPKEALLLSLLRAMPPSEQDNLLKIAIALAPPSEKSLSKLEAT